MGTRDGDNKWSCKAGRWSARCGKPSLDQAAAQFMTISLDRIGVKLALCELEHVWGEWKRFGASNLVSLMIVATAMTIHIGLDLPN